MEKYFENILNKFSPIDLIVDIKIHFGNEKNILPTNNEFENFINEVKAKFIDAIKRLSADEKTLLFDTLIKNYAKDYSGLRKYFLEEIEADYLFSIFPEYKNKKTFHLSNEQISILENKYSLYPCFQSALNEMLIFVEKLSSNLHTQQPKSKTEQKTIEIKPVLKPEAVQTVFDILKDFFSPEQQAELKQVIETGNIARIKLLFKDNGNRLTDTFKKLIEHDFITGCQKRHLETWIVSNFLFLHNGTKKEFKPRSVNKYVSAGKKTVGCKSPLIEIKNGQIQRVEQPRTKKYRKY